MRAGPAAVAILGLLCFGVATGEDKIIFQQDFESDIVGEHPLGNWYFHEGAGASCLVSDEATDVAESPPGSQNLKFAKTETGAGTQITVRWIFEEYAEQVMRSGKLTGTFWVYFGPGQLMRYIAFRGYSPWKQYMKTVVRGNWPDDIRLEFPMNGAQHELSGDSWHKLTFEMEWDPVWPLPAGGIPASSVLCRFFIDDEEHPGSPANLLEDLISPFGSIELNTADWATAVCYIDDISVTTSAPRPEIKSLAWENGRIALEWNSGVDVGGIPSLYGASDPAGPWSLLQGNIESACLVGPGQARRSFYRVGPQEEPSPEGKVIFDDDFESYLTSEDVQTAGGWTIIKGSGAPDVTWRLWNTEGEPLNTEPPNLVGMSGNYMISNSDFGESARLDEELISPIIDCAGYSKVGVEFTCNMNVYEDDPEADPQITDLDLSIYDPDFDRWFAWISVFTRDRTAADWSSEDPRLFSLSPLADGRKVRLRWRFHEAQFDYWWAIDDVTVSGE